MHQQGAYPAEHALAGGESPVLELDLPALALQQGGERGEAGARALAGQAFGHAQFAELAG